MAKIVDVTDVPELPGAGQLHFDDGRPPILALPEIADQHREELGIPTSMSMGVAGPGSGTPDRDFSSQAESQGAAAGRSKIVGDIADAARRGAHWFATGKSAPPAPAVAPQQAIDPVTGTPLPPGVKIGTAAEFPPSPPPAAPAAPPAGEPAPAPAPAAPIPPPPPDEAAIAAQMERDRILDEQRTGLHFIPGKPAPTTDRTTTERGAPYNAKDAAERLKAAGGVLDAQLSGLTAEQQQAEAAAAKATAQNLAAQQEVARRQADMIRKQQAFQLQDAALQQDLADYTESNKPDPHKYWSTLGGGVTHLLSVIGQGLGAWASIRSGTENFAFKAAQAHIQQELAAQEKAFDAGRGDRKNALARLTDFYQGDREMGKLALSQALNKVAETETQRLAAQSRSREISQNAKLLTAQFQNQQLLDEQRRMELAAGKTTTSHESGITPGHSEALTPEQRKANQEYLDRGKDGGLTAKERTDKVIDYGEKKERWIDSKQKLENLATAYGLKVDWETGELKTPDGKRVDPAKVDLKGYGFWDRYLAPDFFKTQAGFEVMRQQEAAATAYRLANTGVAYNPEELASARKHEFGRFGEDAIRILAQQVSDSNKKERELDARYPKSVIDTWRDRYASVNQERARRSGEAPKVTPRVVK